MALSLDLHSKAILMPAAIKQVLSPVSEYWKEKAVKLTNNWGKVLIGKGGRNEGNRFNWA